MTKFWIEHRDTNGELHTIGDEPYEGDTAEDAWADYCREIARTGVVGESIDDYVITAED